ncbi:hypothetical protein CCAX7_40450 [Capsulimonas corticalis]|uniref:Uncharacterized protein n=1 Tax=Capsulimonas corticalis TaxID=2219043 RepID=A0A402D4P7_9BACT|nr:carbohydrate-binding protein [Capsulimonas corticalis]BDI31994.1 hypothetical protein CCAX7_40450 [Capsulimonas corticalis]
MTGSLKKAVTASLVTALALVFGATQQSFAAPYTGAPISLPGVIQAENYDTGGEGVAYHDTTPGNVDTGDGTRITEGVDNWLWQNHTWMVGWTQPGEWLNYTVNVLKTGPYRFHTYASSAGNNAGGVFSILVDGSSVTGNLQVPNTTIETNPVDIVSPTVNLTVGQHVVRLYINATGPNPNSCGNFDQITVTAESTPYGGTAFGLPGIIQAENYDNGGEGFAYHDTTPGNIDTGDGTRITEGVDNWLWQNHTWMVGWTQPGEWLNYTVYVQATDSYKFHVLASSAGNVVGGTFHIEVDGVNATGTLHVPQTTGETFPVDVPSPSVFMTIGQHILRLVIDSTGPNTNSAGNFDYIFVSNDSQKPFLTATAGNAKVDLSWTPIFGATGYVLYRKVGSAGSLSPYLSLPVTTNFTDVDGAVFQYRNYTYAIAAMFGTSAAPQSATVTATPVPSFDWRETILDLGNGTTTVPPDITICPGGPATTSINSSTWTLVSSLTPTSGRGTIGPFSGEYWELTATANVFHGRMAVRSGAGCQIAVVGHDNRYGPVQTYLPDPISPIPHGGYPIITSAMTSFLYEENCLYSPGSFPGWTASFSIGLGGGVEDNQYTQYLIYAKSISTPGVPTSSILDTYAIDGIGSWRHVPVNGVSTWND